jgi:hypothetical protein
MEIAPRSPKKITEPALQSYTWVNAYARHKMHILNSHWDSHEEQNVNIPCARAFFYSQKPRQLSEVIIYYQNYFFFFTPTNFSNSSFSIVSFSTNSSATLRSFALFFLSKSEAFL